MTVSGLQAAAGGSTLGVPITELALLNTFTLLLWQLRAVQQQDSTEGQSSSGDPAVGLGERVLSFCLQLEGIFEASGDLQRLQDCIFRIQADVFLVFSSDKLEVSLGLCLGCWVLSSTLERTPSPCPLLHYSVHYAMNLSMTRFSTALLCALLNYSVHYCVTLSITLDRQCLPCITQLKLDRGNPLTDIMLSAAFSKTHHSNQLHYLLIISMLNSHRE